MLEIRIEHLEHTYRAPALQDRTVLAIDNWQVPAGTHVLLRGISGSGKTTLLNILSGLLPPTKGTVWLGDQALYSLGESRRDQLRATTIGYIFQMHHLAPTLSAVENVEMPLVFGRKMKGSERRARAAELLRHVGLHEFAEHRPVQLSMGQRQRVAVARALAPQPAVVLADEPTAALDVESSADVMNMLGEFCRQSGATLLVASHDPALAARFDWVIDLRAGVLQTPLMQTEQER